jgi:hypothetical protein
MKKTSVYLDEAELASVRRLAESTGTSQAEIIRAAVKAYEQQASPNREFSFLASFEGDGRSMADIPEEELLEGFGR